MGGFCRLMKVAHLEFTERSVVNKTRQRVELMKKTLSLQSLLVTNHAIITPMVKREAMKHTADTRIMGTLLQE